MKKVYLVFSLITIFSFTSCDQNDEISNLSIQSKYDSEKKVNICHYDEDMDMWKTINISTNAVDAHLAHGDYEGECNDGSNDCEPIFYQGFETNYVGWEGYGHPITLNGGYAVLPENLSYYTEFGGHRYTWEGKWSTELDVYLDPNWNSSQGFEYSIAINRTTGQHLRSYVYHVNKDASTGKLLLAVDHNYTYNIQEDLEFYVDNYEVTSAGWYTFQQVFYDNGIGALSVDMNLLDSSGNIVFTQTRSYPSDIILSEIGGIRFGWFTFINVEGGIKIDETELFINCP